MPNKRKSVTASQSTAQNQSKTRSSTPTTSLNSWKEESKSTERSVTWVTKSTLQVIPTKSQSQQTSHSQKDTWSTWLKSTLKNTVWENFCTWLPLERTVTKSNTSTFNKKEVMSNDLDSYLNIFNIRSLSQLLDWSWLSERIGLNSWILIFRAIFFDKLR